MELLLKFHFNLALLYFCIIIPHTKDEQILTFLERYDSFLFRKRDFLPAQHKYMKTVKKKFP